MFSCLQILEACLCFVLITLLNVTLIILTLSVSRLLRLLFFFFQAEDGIRDGRVTGVQTCALPISCQRERLQIDLRRARASRRGTDTPRACAPWTASGAGASAPARATSNRLAASASEIGRASCRERV